MIKKLTKIENNNDEKGDEKKGRLKRLRIRDDRGAIVEKQEKPMVEKEGGGSTRFNGGVNQDVSALESDKSDIHASERPIVVDKNVKRFTTWHQPLIGGACVDKFGYSNA
ncbi:unnamed protein product [Cochlearia groenlandica]